MTYIGRYPCVYIDKCNGIRSIHVRTRNQELAMCTGQMCQGMHAEQGVLNYCTHNG